MTYISRLGKFLDVMGVDQGIIAHSFALMDWDSEEEVDAFIADHFTPPAEPFPAGMAPDVAWGAREHTPALEVYPGGRQPAQIHTGPRPMPTAAQRIATGLRGGIQFDDERVDVTGVRDRRPVWAPSVQQRIRKREYERGEHRARTEMNRERNR